MVEFLVNYGEFLLKAVTIVFSIVFVIGAIINTAQKAKAQKDRGHISIKNLNEEIKGNRDYFLENMLDKDELKAHHKAEKKKEKEAAKEEKQHPRKNLFVLDFNGDIKASEAEELRREVSAIIDVAKEGDEVLIKLESPGGMVHGYGFASSQLARLKAASIKLTVAVDKVAASGGYMMACVADKIIAAPFAVIGSIGVVAQLPNFHRLLKKHDVDYEQFTAGEYKRTVTVFGENTEKAKAKFQDELEETHVLFKEYITQMRAKVDIEQVATGEHWYGTHALQHNLVDAIGTSDDFILNAAKTMNIYEVCFEEPETLADKLGFAAAKVIDSFLLMLRKDARELSGK